MKLYLCEKPSQAGDIATDADREGEMIACEVLEHFAYRGPVRR